MTAHLQDFCDFLEMLFGLFTQPPRFVRDDARLLKQLAEVCLADSQLVSHVALELLLTSLQ